MPRRTAIAIVIAFAVINAAHADVRFSIRYHDKNIYYPGDDVQLRLTLSNPVESGEPDMTFHISDDPRESFGFELRSLTGEPMPPAEGFASGLNNKDAYRIVHLAQGQELSITVSLNDWVELSEPDQYRLTGFFFPRRRDRSSPSVIAESVLDLTMLPDTRPRWEEEINEEVRSALLRRDLDPAAVVMETLENRRDGRFNRAAIYLDTESLVLSDRNISDPDRLERMLREGSWDSLPGFEHPVTNCEFVSSRVYPGEATVRIKAAYNPYGEPFNRDLRFYLHDVDGYWAIRRIDALSESDADPAVYGSSDLEPPEVVTEMLNAASRGDWDVVLRYYEVEDIVRNLPEYADDWKNMSASEHRAATDDYRRELVSGRLDEERSPLKDIDSWKISRVNYTDVEGSVVVENTRTHDTANGPMPQQTVYTFRLVRSVGDDGRWQVVRYDTAVVRR